MLFFFNRKKKKKNHNVYLLHTPKKKVDVEGFDLAVILGAVEQITNHVWFIQFEWGGNKFRPDPDDPDVMGHRFTSFSEATDALDDLGFTCYLTGDRYQSSRTLIQVTGCFKHNAFCEAVGNNCERLREVPDVKPKKLSSLPGGWGRYGDMVCGKRKLTYVQKKEKQTYIYTILVQRIVITCLHVLLSIITHTYIHIIIYKKISPSEA
jgi:hypothetical protein